MEAERAPARGWNDLFEFQTGEVSRRGARHEADLGKSRNLRALLPMESLRVLPSDGIPAKEIVDLPLSRLSEAAGYKWPSSYARLLRRCHELIDSRRRWGSPSKHEWKAAQSTRQRGKRAWKGHNMPSARELAQHPALGRYFAGAKAGGGYHMRPGFIHHPNFPGTPNDRVVLSQLADQDIFCGEQLLEDVTQVELSRRTGLCTDTVRAILRKYSIYTRRVWETDAAGHPLRDDRGRLILKRELDPSSGRMRAVRVEERGEFPLFRIISLPGHWTKGSIVLEKWEPGARWEQPPCRIVYLGDRVVDSRTMVIETQRLIELAEKKAYTRELWWQHVARIHGQVMGRHVGTEAHLKTVWKFCRIELESGGYGVPGRALDDLFPGSRGPT